MIIAIVNCFDKANTGEEGDTSNIQISRQVESGRRGKSVKQERMGKQTVITVVLVVMLCLALLLSYGLQPIRLLCGVHCHFLLQGIFPTQGLNPHFLHWQMDSLPLSHLGSPLLFICVYIYIYMMKYIELSRSILILYLIKMFY